MAEHLVLAEGPDLPAVALTSDESRARLVTHRFLTVMRFTLLVRPSGG